MPSTSPEALPLSRGRLAPRGNSETGSRMLVVGHPVGLAPILVGIAIGIVLRGLWVLTHDKR